ncbi:hypothetical protein [[Phormidium] sp. ETS-05]|uniref:hypothetical protein n=1 Tax=[Phormidium] sp. ETS-05 TaxID=222819 RepID=UPI0018EEEEF4|nr:hypothetical protein [[Phormidium] sp. ETS-05]
MGLFDQIISAVGNQSQMANVQSLTGIIGAVQQLGNTYGLNSQTTQVLFSTVGGYVRSSLQEKQQTEGAEQAQTLVNQFSGTSPNMQAVMALFSQSQLGQMVGDLVARTGLNQETIQQILPLVVPLVLNFLQAGADKLNPQLSNPVLQSFLDADGDGDVDIADAIALAGKFLK